MAARVFSEDMTLPPRTEVGSLGVYQLKRLWSQALDCRRGRPHPVDPYEFEMNRLVIDALGLGLNQTFQYLMHAGPSFEEFERWIARISGRPATWQIERLNATVTGSPYPADVRRWLAAIEAAEPVLSPEQLTFWDEHGYVVLENAVCADSREAAARAIFDHLGVRPDDPESWYRTSGQHGIMVEYFQHPAFAANRRSPRIHKAFAQLWGTPDLWVTTDRVGFNSPERPGRKFHGPDLHWDVPLQLPIPLGIQGILYLTDTPAEQGAFTCVPGFHRRIADWLQGLPRDRDPAREDLHALGSAPIAGNAGDMVIWHQALPHGSRPNRGTRPRVVQYIKMYPAAVANRPMAGAA